MPKRKFTGYLKNLEPISSYVTTYAHQARLDDAQVYAVQLAVDEAATNIIEHGYRGEGKGNLWISCMVLPDGLQITIQDNAPPFAAEDVPAPNISIPLEELKPRGLGIYLMRKMMDTVEFQHIPGVGNTLIMRKHKSTHRDDKGH